MKAGLLVLAATLAAAHPHHAHNHAHKRAVATKVEVVTVQGPDVIVYVDASGNTVHVQGSLPTPAPEPVHVAEPVSVPEVNVRPVAVAAVPSPAAAHGPVLSLNNGQVGYRNPWAAAPAAAPVVPNSRVVSPAAPVVAAPAVAKPAPAPQIVPAAIPPSRVVAAAAKSYNDPVEDGSPAQGITWSPYTTKGGPCKSVDQAISDFGRMGGMGVVRIYGTDCDQTNVAIKAAKVTNKRVFAGIFNIDNARGEAELIADAVRANGNDWSIIDTVSIGNEDVGAKGRSVDSVQQAMAAGRPVLRAAGYNGPIVHVDTSGAFLSSVNRLAGICDFDTAGDYVAANVHPFFNAQTNAGTAGVFVRSQVALLQGCAAVSSRKRDGGRVRVTEAGWPKAGQNNGAAVPGVDNQRTAVAAIKREVPDVLLFSAFNARWQDPGYLGVEPFWGILDD